MPQEASTLNSRKGKLPAEKSPERPSPTTRIGKIASLQRKPNKSKALDLLHTLASHVAPILQKYNLKVGILREMYPKNDNLLGLNVNGGATILIRLRYHRSENSFLPMNDLIGTMLHELVHNTFGPHDKRFYDLLDEYKESYHMIGMKGSFYVTGKFSINEKLGGSRGTSRNIADLKELRLKKYQPKKQYVSETRRLGNGNNQEGGCTLTNKQGKSLKELVREAVEKRERDSMWCSSNDDYNAIKEDFDNDELEIMEERDFIKCKKSNKTDNIEELLSKTRDRFKSHVIYAIDSSTDDDGHENKIANDNRKKSQRIKKNVEIVDLT